MIKLYNNNCIDVLKNMSNESVDLVVTSPPYDNLRNYNNSSEWNFELFKILVKELYRVVKQGGYIVWIVADATNNYNKSGTSFRQAIYFQENGFNILDNMIWYKGGFTDVASCKFRYPNTYENMFILAKGKPKTFNPIKDRVNKWAGHKISGGSIRLNDGTTKPMYSNGKTISSFGVRFNVWGVTPVKDNNIRKFHPAQFPIQLAKDHIISWSNEGDVVLDCFMGSGTTGIACKELNRRFIGIEIDKSYYEIAKNRINNTEVTK